MQRLENDPSTSDQIATRALHHLALIVNLQKMIRGKLNRNHYQVIHLPKNKATRNSTYVVGNDPALPSTLIEHQYPNDKIAVVGTSGLRSIEIACRVGSSAKTPKIFIIDNSEYVCQFWSALRDMMQNNNDSKDQSTFLAALPAFLDTNGCYIKQLESNILVKKNTDTVQYLDQDVTRYLIELFSKHGYDRVRNIIKHVSIIKQEWNDTNTIIKLKNIIAHLGIKTVVAYPSNIAHVIEKNKAIALIANLAILAPTLTIATDLDPKSRIPKNIFLIQSQRVEDYTHTLFHHCVSNETAREVAEKAMLIQHTATTRVNHGK